MKLNKKLWWLLLPATIVAGTVTTVLLVLPKAPGLSINSKYSKEELFNMEKQVENAFEIAAKDNYGYAETTSNYLSTDQSDFLDSVNGFKSKFDDKFSTLMEHSDTFEDRLEIANALEEEAKDNDLSICSWDKVEEQKYSIMQDYITSNLEGIAQKGDEVGLNSDDKIAFREDVYNKATALGQEIDELAEKNESITEFLLTSEDSNVLKQYITKVNTNLLGPTNTFSGKQQTKIQTRATYAFDDINDVLKIATDENGNQCNLETELNKNNALGDVVSMYGDDGTNPSSANKNYKYIKEDAATNEIPFFQWNYKFWDSSETWTDDADVTYVGKYQYNWGKFNGYPLQPDETDRHPILGSNPALGDYQVRLAVQVNDDDEVSYDFNPTDCTATYHLNVVIVDNGDDADSTFQVTNDANETTTYHYMNTYPIDFTQPASRLQVRDYLVQQNKDVLNIDQTNETVPSDENLATDTGIANPINVLKSLGAVFDKKTFTGDETNDGEGLLITPFEQKYDTDSDEPFIGNIMDKVNDGQPMYLQAKEADEFFRIKINFKDVSQQDGWSSKLFNYITNRDSQIPFTDINGKPITNDSKSASVTISTLNAMLKEIDYVSGVNDVEYQGLQVVAKVTHVDATIITEGASPVSYTLTTQLFLRHAQLEPDAVKENLGNGDKPKYLYDEYPILAGNHCPYSSTTTDNYDDDWDINNYLQYYRTYQASNAFDNIKIPLHYTNEEKAYLNFCDNVKAHYSSFEKIANLALNLEDVGNKFYEIYDKHAPLLPLYITCLAALIVALALDGLLLISYILSLPGSITMTILQGIIVALDIVFIALTSVQLSNIAHENKEYDAEKEVWDSFLPEYKMSLQSFKDSYQTAVSEYNHWTKVPSASNAGVAYNSMKDYYANVIDGYDGSINHNLDYLLCKMFNAFKPFIEDEGIKKTDYIHISFDTDFDDIISTTGTVDDVSCPFNATFDIVVETLKIFVAAIAGCIAVNIAFVAIKITAAAARYSPLALWVTGYTYTIEGSATSIEAAGSSAEVSSKISRLYHSSPFSIARIIVIVVILAISIATLVITIQLQSMIDKYCDFYK